MRGLVAALEERLEALRLKRRGWGVTVNSEGVGGDRGPLVSDPVSLTSFDESEFLYDLTITEKTRIQ